MTTSEKTQNILREATAATLTPLSDVARTRVLARIEQAIAEQAVVPARRRWRSAVVVASVAAAAAIAVAVVARDAPSHAPRAGSDLVRTVEAGAGQMERVRLGSDLEIVLVGPGQLDVVTTPPAGLLLRLRGGAVMGHYDVTSARKVVIEAGEVRARLVDSQFAVTWQRGTVAVSRGEEAGALLARFEHELGTRPGSTAPPAGTGPVPPGAPSRDVPPRSTAPSLPEKTRVEPTAEVATNAGAATDAEVATDAGVGPEGDGPATEAEALYRRAESAMVAGDTVMARALLGQLIARFPRDLVADAARYDAALLAFRVGDLAAALDAVNGLTRWGRDPSLLLPARRLRCQILAAQGVRSADEACTGPATGFQRRDPPVR